VAERLFGGAGQEESIGLTCFNLLLSSLIGEMALYPPVFSLNALEYPVLERLHKPH